MKNKSIVITLILYILTGGYAFSQYIKKCATTEMTQKQIDENPHLLQEIIKNQQKLEEYTQEFTENHKQKKSTSGPVYIVPVVVHVVHACGPENISDAQVFDGMRILNEDFRKLNADTGSIVNAFKSIAADSEIEFRLARKDPNGNCTNGIVRVESSYLTNNGPETSVKADIWPRNKYLNIWTAADIGGAAGYAYLPPFASSSVDGVMILHDYFGSIGTGGIERSRALTHEVGHYLNLLHTWGTGNDAGDAGNCSMDDLVGDTPNTIGWLGCNLNGTSCSSLDNVQNYMEYAYCSRMYTEGQKTRMRAAITSTTAQRNNLWSPSNLSATGVNEPDILCVADFTNDNSAGCSDNLTICPGEVIGFFDASYQGQISWNWSFPGGTPNTSTDENPVITYNTPGVYDVSLSVSNGIDNVSTTKTAYINVMIPKTVPFTESFESVTIPGNDWLIINNDGGNTWELTTAASYSPVKSLFINHFSGNTAGQIDDAISSIIDMSVMISANLTFKVAYAQKNSTTNDVLFIHISNDCGNTWEATPLLVNSGTALSSVGYKTTYFIPADTSEWRGKSIAIPTQNLTENTRFRFRTLSGEGNNLYIDDINIDGVYEPIPILISPPNYSTGQPVNATLDWNAVVGSAYHQYEVDTSLLFSSPLLISGTKAYTSSPSNTNPDTEEQLTGLDTATTYYWRVRAMSIVDTMNWSSIWRFTTGSAVGIEDAPLSDVSMLIFPNPTENYPVISLNLNKPEYVTLKMYDVLGREILNLIYEKLNAGTYMFEPEIEYQGIYFVKLTVGDKTLIRKIIKLGN